MHIRRGYNEATEQVKRLRKRLTERVMVHRGLDNKKGEDDMKKRFLSSILIVGLVASLLGGCGNEQNVPADGTQQTESEQTTESSQTTENTENSGKVFRFQEMVRFACVTDVRVSISTAR